MEDADGSGKPRESRQSSALDEPHICCGSEVRSAAGTVMQWPVTIVYTLLETNGTKHLMMYGASINKLAVYNNVQEHIVEEMVEEVILW